MRFIYIYLIYVYIDKCIVFNNFIIFLLPLDCPVRADITILLDASGSITWLYPQNWNLMLEFVQKIVQAFPIGRDATQLAIVKFSTNANVEFYLDRYTDKADLLKAINELVHPSGETNIAAALRRMRTDVFTSHRGDRANVKNIALIITDGNPNVDAASVPREAQAAKDADIEIFAVGITEDVDDYTLNGLASDPDDDHVFRVSDFNQLYRIVNEVIRKSCQGFTKTIAPNPTPSSTTPMSTSTTSTRASTTPSTTTSTTTRAPTLPPVEGCSGNADVVFVLDASGSIGETNFNTMLNFVRNVVNEVSIDTGNLRMGILTYRLA